MTYLPSELFLPAFSTTPLRGATKLDETETIGNVLSFADRTGLQLLFFTDGQKVPEDLEKASTSVILDHLKGFGLDIKTSKSQISKGI